MFQTKNRLLKKLFKNISKNNDGFSSIFIVIILGSILSFLAVFNFCIENVAKNNISDNVFRLAGRSILADYDIDLYNEYKILGISLSEKKIEEKFSYYSKRKDVNEKLTTKANLKEFSILDINNFKRQLLNASSSIKTLSNKSTARKKEEDIKYRSLNNEIIKEGLPSYGYFKDASLLDKFGENFYSKINAIKDYDNFFQNILNESLIDNYLFKTFNSYVYKNSKEENFFRNELEYILEGNFDDKKNYEDVLFKIKLVRIVLNSLHISTCSKKMNQVKALAEAANIVGPEGELLATAGLILLWATSESDNDIELLKEGKSVPFFKSENDFALENLLEVTKGLSSEKVVYPKSMSNGNSKKSQGYFDYLKFFLIFQDENEKILRVMDLIQINMKTKYNKDFLIRERYIGFRISANNGSKEFNYVQKY